MKGRGYSESSSANNGEMCSYSQSSSANYGKRYSTNYGTDYGKSYCYPQQLCEMQSYY